MTSFLVELTKHVETAFEKADKENSKITDEILKMEGMSGRKRDIYIIIF